MRKSRLLRFTVLFLLVTTFVTSLHAEEQFSDFIRLGHADELLEGYDNLANPDQKPTFKRAVAIYIPATRMKPCIDNYITNIKLALAFGVFFEENGLKIFVTKDLNAPYDYEQNVPNVTAMWNDIPLTTPFKINGEGIYIGYEYYSTYKNNFGRLTSNTDTSKDWYYRDGEWKPSENSNALAIQGIVKGEKLPKYNVELKNTELLTYTELNKNITISGEFTNLGTATIHSFNVNYRLNGGEWISQTIDNVNIPYENSGSFQTNHLALPDIGEYNVEISVDQLNGQNDIDPSDNISQTYRVGCVNSYTARNVLLEIFSTELCPNCPEGHIHLNAVVNDNKRVIRVGHHAGYGTDKLTIQPSVDYEWFYNHSLSAPSIMLDRSNQNKYNSQYPDYSPVFNAKKLTAEQLEHALSIPAFATVNLHVEYNEETREATVQVDGKRLLPPAGDNSRLFVYLTENNIYTSTQSGAFGQAYYHQHALRKVLTDTWGDEIDLTTTYSADYRVHIEDTLNVKEMYAVAFVANYNPEDVNNCVIYNSAQTKLIRDDSAVEQHGFTKIVVGTNRKLISIEGEYNGFHLYNLAGECLKESPVSISEISAEDLPNGLYLLQLKEKEGQRIYKILLSE